MIERPRDSLKQNALLRVHLLGLARRKPKVPGIKVEYSVQKPRILGIALAQRLAVGVKIPNGRPAIIGNGPDIAPTFDQCIPDVLYAIGTRKTRRVPDDSNILGIKTARVPQTDLLTGEYIDGIANVLPASLGDAATTCSVKFFSSWFAIPSIHDSKPGSNLANTSEGHAKSLAAIYTTHLAVYMPSRRHLSARSNRCNERYPILAELHHQGRREKAVMSLLFRTIDQHLDRKAIRIPEREVPMGLRRQLLQLHGDFPLAYPAITEKYLTSFGDERGMISYAQKMGVTFALGDPVATQANQPNLLSDFVDAFRSPVFVACQRHTAEALSSMGYSVNEFGYDSAIDLDGHSFSGRAFKRVRYGTNWLRTNGMTVSEAQDSDVSNKAIKQLSGRWRKTRVTRREVRFLNREFSPEKEPDVRRFYAIASDGTVAGLINFDPVFSGGEITGYLASQKRRLSKDAAYLDLAIMRHAIDTFQSEGLRTVFMGISPVAEIRPSGFGREQRWLRHAFRAAHNSDWVNGRFFNSKGLAEYKNRFRGRRIPLYFCLPPGGSGLLKVVALLRLIRLV